MLKQVIRQVLCKIMRLSISDIKELKDADIWNAQNKGAVKTTPLFLLILQQPIYFKRMSNMKFIN